jgi:hypothetical protein
VRRGRYRYSRSASFACDLLDSDFKNPSSLGREIGKNLHAPVSMTDLRVSVTASTDM